MTSLAFWKVPSRKLYAIATERKRSKTQSDSDDEFDGSAKKQMPTKHTKLDHLMQDVKELKEAVKSALHVSQDTPIPLGLKLAVRDAFKCSISLTSPIKPPVIITTCCKVIFGCNECVNEWFSGRRP